MFRRRICSAGCVYLCLLVIMFAHELVDGEAIIEKEEDQISSSKQKSGTLTKTEHTTETQARGGDIVIARGTFPFQIKARLHGAKISNIEDENAIQKFNLHHAYRLPLQRLSRAQLILLLQRHSDKQGDIDFTKLKRYQLLTRLQALIAKRAGGLRLIRPTLLTNVNIVPDNLLLPVDNHPNKDSTENESLPQSKPILPSDGSQEDDLIFGKNLKKEIKNLEARLSKISNTDPESVQKVAKIRQTLSEFRSRYEAIKNEFVKRLQRVRSEIDPGIGTVNQLLNNLLPASDSLEASKVLTNEELTNEQKNKLATTTEATLIQAHDKNSTISLDDANSTLSSPNSTEQAETSTVKNVKDVDAQLEESTTQETNEENSTDPTKIIFDEKTFGVWTTPKKTNILGVTEADAEEIETTIATTAKTEPTKKPTKSPSTLTTETPIASTETTTETTTTEIIKETTTLPVVENSNSKEEITTSETQKTESVIEVKPKIETTTNKKSTNTTLNKTNEKYLVDDEAIGLPAPKAKPVPARILAAPTAQLRQIIDSDLLITENNDNSKTLVSSIISEDDVATRGEIMKDGPSIKGITDTTTQIYPLRTTTDIERAEIERAEIINPNPTDPIKLLVTTVAKAVKEMKKANKAKQEDNISVSELESKLRKDLELIDNKTNLSKESKETKESVSSKTDTNDFEDFSDDVREEQTCDAIACDFEDGSLCQWKASTDELKLFDKNYYQRRLRRDDKFVTRTWHNWQGRYRNRLTGIARAQIFSHSNKRFAATYVRPMQVATLTAKMLSPNAETVRFRVWEAARNVQLRLCCDNTKNCVFETERGIKKGSRRWREFTATCPKGTQNIIFECRNDGIYQGACGLDNVHLLNDYCPKLIPLVGIIENNRTLRLL